MKKMRSLGLISLLVLPLGCATGSFLWYRLAPDYPASDARETLRLPGLSAKVTVYYDHGGAPHIEAQNEPDLMRAVGFVQARDRFFAMDAMRRLASGRLCELVGEQPFLAGTTVELDRAMLGWGLRDSAREDAAALDEDSRAAMQAYAQGVNAALAEYEPLEYRLLRVTPDPWQVEDSLAVGRLNAWSVSHNWEQELSRLLLALHTGADRALAVYPGEPWAGPTSITGNAARHELPPEIAPELRELFLPRAPEPAASSGPLKASLASELATRTGASNAWVVGGARSVSGRPLLAGDPHLALLLPTIFYEMHIKAPSIDVIGMTVAGLPFILAGRNSHLSWGTTAAVADVIDLFVEKPRPESSAEVLGPQGWYRLTERDVAVRVRVDGEIVERHFPLRVSRHGPLLNDMYPDLLPAWAPPIALQWYTGEPGTSIRALAAANRARNVGELRAALAHLATPVNVWIAADTDGQVALMVNGRVPVRKAHRGTFPAPGWLAAYDWDGFYDPEAMPHGMAGEDGAFANANNLVRDPRESDVAMNVDSGPSYRVERILERLQAVPKHDAKSFAAMQNDILSLRARRLVPALLADLDGLSELSATETAALAALRRWDFVASAESAAALVFFATYRQAAVLALEDEVDAHALAYLLSQRYLTNPLDQWLANPAQAIWDDRRTEAVEDRAVMVRRAFRRAVAEIAAKQGEDVASWQWGAVHVTQPRHFFGSQKALASLVNLAPTPAGGGIDTIWKAHFDMGHPASPFAVSAGPAARMVIDLADGKGGLWVLSTGNSGWPGSPHYGDQYESWRKGELIPMLYDWAEIRDQAEGVLVLE